MKNLFLKGIKVLKEEGVQQFSKKLLRFVGTRISEKLSILAGIILEKVTFRKPRENQRFEPVVSVLLTSYNRPRMLQEAIESVLDQTYQNFELIILDDNSNEETLKIIQQYLKNPKVRFYKSAVKDEDRWKEARYAVLINEGLKIAKGELITYLCDDDYFLPHRLEKMVKFLEEHPSIKVCYGRQRMIPGNQIRRPDRVLRSPGFQVDHSSVMHYKSCIDEVGNWDTNNVGAADAVFWNKLGAKFPFYPIREILDVHCYHSESISSKMGKGEHLKWKREK